MISFIDSEKSMFRSSVVAVPVSIATAGMTFLFSTWAIRNLPSSDVVTFVVYMSFVNIVGMSLGGVQAALTKKSVFQGKTEDKRKRLNPELVLIGLIALAGALIFVLSLWWNLPLGLPTFMVTLVSATPIGLVVWLIIGARLTASGRFATLASFSFVSISLNLSLQLLVSHWIEPRVTTLTAITVLTNVSLGCLALFASRSDRIREGRLLDSQTIRITLLAFFLAFLTQFDVLVMGLVLGESDRSDYATASVLVKSVLFFAGFANGAIFSIALRRTKRGESLRDVAIVGLALSALVILAGAIVMYVWGEGLILSLYGDKWEGASSLVFPLFLATTPFVLVATFGQLVMVKPSWFLIFASTSLATTAAVAAFFFVNQPLGLAGLFGSVGLVFSLVIVVELLRGRSQVVARVI